ncbi:hypothetical protein Tco_0353096 [Tanacetum coccineum]
MLSVLLLLYKYRLRNVPVIEPENPLIKNIITQSTVVQGLKQCKGKDWLFSSQSNELILEEFKKMKDYQIGGLLVVEGPLKKIVGNKLTVKDFLNIIVATSEENIKVVSPITCKVSNDAISIITLRDFLLHHRTFKLLNGGP